MKSMVLTGIRKMEMKEVPDPFIVLDTDVLVKMKATGVCGSDVHYFKHGRIGSQVVSYPFPVGHEGAGEVVKTGSRVSRVKKGDRVAIEPAMPCGSCEQCISGRPHTCLKLKFLGCPGQADGCLSEYIVLPEANCFPIPDHLSYYDAVLSEPLAIGTYALNLSVPIQGVRIGILGFGPIGMSVMLAARAKGASTFYVTDLVKERIDIARSCGAVYAGHPEKEDIVSIICGLEPNRLDTVFECCGKQEAVDQALQILKPGGKLMIVGIPEFDLWSFPTDIIRRKELTIQNVRRQNETLDETLQMLSQRSIDTSSMVTHSFPFSKTQEAFELVSGYKDGVMKAMIDF